MTETETIDGFVALDREITSLVEVIGMVEQIGLGFEPGETHYSDIDTDQTGKFSWNRARNVKRAFSVRGGPQDDDGEPSCFLNVLDDPMDRLVKVNWTMPEDQIGELGNNFGELSTKAGFVYGVITDPEMFWQSTDQVDPYHYLRRSLDGVRFLPDGRIDTSQNPGRMKIVLGLWFVAGAQIWFGSTLCGGLFDRDRVLAAPGKVTERPDGVIEVDLYDLSEPIETIRERQRAFRDAVGLDSVVKRASQIERNLVPDQDIDVDTEGPFAHGGTYRTTVWHDAGGNRIHRSAAATETVTEFDDDGRVMHQATSP